TAMPKGVRNLGLIHGISCPLEPETIPRSWLDGVRCEHDAKVRIHALSRGSSALIDGIPWSVRHIRAPQAWSKSTGLGVRIGVIDTGVDYRHPDLAESVERGINLIYRTVPPHDDN